MTWRINAVAMAALALTAPYLATAAARSTEGQKYAQIAGGNFRSILPTGTAAAEVAITPFRLQRVPVSNGDFLQFVRTHREWRRGNVAPRLADSRYLESWQDPLRLGRGVHAEQPVTQVSWFAARAYCESQHARLPTWTEWELVAAADARNVDARRDAVWQSKILSWYSHPSTTPLSAVGQQPANVYGVHDMHGLIWEWVEDFNALFVSGDSREQGDPDRLKFCGTGALSVQDREDYPVMMRLALLSSLKGNSTTVNLGFRCAVDRKAKYVSDILLQTADGRRTAFQNSAGRVRIVTMFYSSCPMACPLTIDTLRGIDAKLTPAEREKVDVLMISIDPKRDTPQKLRSLAAERRLDTTRWTLARPAPGDVRKISALLDIPYRKLDDGGFNHASVLVLMDANDRMVARSGRFGTPDPDFVAAIRNEIRTSAPPK